MTDEMKAQAIGSILMLGLIAGMFVVLRCCGVIDWPWLWVFCPLWVPASIVAAMVVTVFVISAVYHLIRG